MAQVFNQQNLTDLQAICTKIANLCAEQVDGSLTFAQMMFMGSLIKEFANSPIVATSGIVKLKDE